MEGKMEPVLCELQYSGAVAALLGLAALASVGIAAALPWTPALRASVALGVIALALRAHHTVFSVRLLRISADGRVSLALGDGLREGQLEDGSFVAPWLTLVRWRPAGARFDRTVLVAPGMAHPEAFRRLRVRLRHG